MSKLYCAEGYVKRVRSEVEMISKSGFSLKRNGMTLGGIYRIYVGIEESSKKVVVKVY